MKNSSGETFVKTVGLTLTENQLSFLKELTRTVSSDAEAVEHFVYVCSEFMVDPQEILNNVIKPASSEDFE